MRKFQVIPTILTNMQLGGASSDWRCPLAEDFAIKRNFFGIDVRILAVSLAACNHSRRKGHVGRSLPLIKPVVSLARQPATGREMMQAVVPAGDFRVEALLGRRGKRRGLCVVIVFVHLLNDRSGSPKMLALAIKALASSQGGDRLFVGSDGSGELDEVGLVPTRYWYRRSSFRLLTLFSYVASQIMLFIRLLMARDIDRRAIVYVNTLLPFGASLYGRLTGRRVVYHLHEVSVVPAPLKWFLLTVARHTASRLIYVSNFHRRSLPVPGVSACTVRNALDEPFRLRAIANIYQHRRQGVFNVLMLASLRNYKGIPELLELARRVSVRHDIRFDLVANDDEHIIRRYFAGVTLPPNLEVHGRTDDPGRFYAGASVVLNLSRPDLCVETFGLTVLEAMAFGIPVIAPPVGGPAELVEHGREGFLIDSNRNGELTDVLLQLADNEGLCRRLSNAARISAERYSEAAFSENLREFVGRQPGDR